MPDRPNILWIYGEDMYPDLSCYGTPVVHTPHLDTLASQGALYKNAFVTAPVCSSSRSGIITGMYQTSFGAHHHRSRRDWRLPDDVRLVTDCFRDAGYFTCNNPGPPNFGRPGKTDFNFLVDKPFDGVDWSEREPGQPFYAQINIPDTHRDFVNDPDRPVDPAEVELPPYYPDHPITRKDWAMWLETVQVLDRKIGHILKRLDDEGLADNTIVFFLSDHGRAHCRCKQFLYDGGIRIPLIIRWPGGIEPGIVVDDMVSAIDLAPTSLKLAGIEPSENMQGIDLFDDDSTRDHIISCRDRCDGTDDRIRCVRNHRYKYIRNYYPELPYMQFNSYKKLQYPVWTLIEHLGIKGELTPVQQHFTTSRRPPEELYDLETDPHEVHNLAQAVQNQEVLVDMRGRLDGWMTEYGDLAEETEDVEIAIHWDEDMARGYRERMAQRGLSPEIPHEDYLKWWEGQLGL